MILYQQKIRVSSLKFSTAVMITFAAWGMTLRKQQTAMLNQVNSFTSEKQLYGPLLSLNELQGVGAYMQRQALWSSLYFMLKQDPSHPSYIQSKRLYSVHPILLICSTK